MSVLHRSTLFWSIDLISIRFDSSESEPDRIQSMNGFSIFNLTWSGWLFHNLRSSFQRKIVYDIKRKLSNMPQTLCNHNDRFKIIGLDLEWFSWIYEIKKEKTKEFQLLSTRSFYIPTFHCLFGWFYSYKIQKINS